MLYNKLGREGAEGWGDETVWAKKTMLVVKKKGREEEEEEMKSDREDGDGGMKVAASSYLCSESSRVAPETDRGLTYKNASLHQQIMTALKPDTKKKQHADQKHSAAALTATCLAP